MDFNYYYVKLIILKDLMSLLIHYVSQLFYFDILSFKSFILVLYIFKIYHFGHFLKFKSQIITFFFTENRKKYKNNTF